MSRDSWGHTQTHGTQVGHRGAHEHTVLRITQKNLTTGKNRYSAGKPFKNTGAGAPGGQTQV